MLQFWSILDVADTCRPKTDYDELVSPNFVVFKNKYVSVTKFVVASTDKSCQLVAPFNSNSGNYWLLTLIFK